MKIYSHSKLGTFEQCPLKYKFKYIDKIIPEIEKSIEAHLGNCVHLTLEDFYLKIQKGEIPPLDGVIIKYITVWNSEFKPELVIVKKDLTAKDYFEQGIKFLIDYYTTNKPFKENTLEVEKKVFIDLDEETKLIGFIDRLVHNLETGEIEIHDYKTNNSQPARDHGEKDKQLALYAIAIKEIFGEEREVTLVWHFLAHNKKLTAKRTNAELQKLKKETLEFIREIKNTTEFPTNKSPLCNWCRYKNFCPAWGGDPSKAKRYKFKEN
jgi:putative RecB family exonuclease